MGRFVCKFENPTEIILVSSHGVELQFFDLGGVSFEWGFKVVTTITILIATLIICSHLALNLLTSAL